MTETKIDAIVREWLEENIQLIEDCYKGSREDDPVEGNQDYQALRRVLDYMTPPGGLEIVEKK